MLAWLLACAPEVEEAVPTGHPDTGYEAPCEGADGDGYCPDRDCDDNDPAINPGAEEVCNGVDDDCDREVDEDVDAVETCNGVDDDCDGEVDEGFAPNGYLDEDGDGYGGGPAAWCEGVAAGGDCDDGDRWANPGAVELCDGVDQDCAGDGDGDACEQPACTGGGGLLWGEEDLTLLAAAGTAESPAELALAGPGTLWVCSGTWHVSLALTDEVAVRAAGGGAALTGVVSTTGPSLVLEGLDLAGPVRAEGTAEVLLAAVEMTGAAVSTDEGGVTARDCTFTGASAAEGPGGAIATVLGDVTVERCVFADNTAGDETVDWACGAAIGTAEGDISIVGSTFTRNVARGAAASFGGAVCAWRGDVGVTGSTFTDNVAGVGGGVWTAAGRVTCADNTWSGNQPDDVVVGAESQACE